MYVALDSELNREVALKQILEQIADDPVSRERFLLEAEVTGALEHPGIVPVYALGNDDRGRPFYAMRFVRGDSLKEAIERFHAPDRPRKDRGNRSLELRQLLRRFLDVCNAIEYAHSRGVLHRDIKPGNIIVGKHGETLVIDWGLAKPVGRREQRSESAEVTLRPFSSSRSADTQMGSALGTPAYMSPEQARGELDEMGPTTDVYSLGATLSFLLTGKPPFEGNDALEVLRKVQRGEFVAPRTLRQDHSPGTRRHHLEGDGLAPSDRYPSARPWPTTSTAGSPTRRSRPTVTRTCWTSSPAGCAGTAPARWPRRWCSSPSRSPRSARCSGPRPPAGRRSPGEWRPGWREAGPLITYGSLRI